MDHHSESPDHHCIYEDLYNSLSLLNDKTDTENLFMDLCTPQELKSMAERWRVAQLIEKGLSYRNINEVTGVSTATITRVARSLTQGSGGYAVLLKAKDQLRNEKTKNCDTKERKT